MAQVSVKNLTKKFGNTFAVNDITLELPDGKLTVLVGPSGCGKTTLLRMLAGLEEPTEGEIYIGDKELAHVPAWDRNVAMVFQSYALYPHMTVFKNMAFPLEARKTSKSEIKRRVEEAAGILGLENLLSRYPRQLSGGQMQRVAIGRAIVRQPDVFLMDEPLSNLDAKLRVSMRAELKRLQRTLGVTTVYVTHDQAEAMTLGDNLVVMHDGCVLQVDYPEEMYNYPRRMFVAGFIGNPGMNFIYCTLSTDKGELAAANFLYKLLPPVRAEFESYPANKNVVLGIRPEDIIVDIEPSAEGIEASIYMSEALGKETLLTLSCGDNLLKAYVPPGWWRTGKGLGDTVWMSFPVEALRIFDAETEEILLNGASIAYNEERTGEVVSEKNVG
jgi:multiple sugar transport system ATP-binding protein